MARTLSMAEMAASIAHQLNQPMTALMSHAYACREWANSEPLNIEKVSVTAEKIVQESARASAVVRRVRALFSNDEPIRVKSNLNLIVQDSARLLRDEAIREGVKIELQLAKGLPDPEIDPVQIQQVLINLSKNAIEAMGDSALDRKLTLSSAREGDAAILVTVADTGPGIAAEVIQDIFEPFFSTKKNGTGIGLAICRSIVEGHSGHIQAKNAASGGAVVQFTIPIRA
jgi:signal transduction histidine kinase